MYRPADIQLRYEKLIVNRPDCQRWLLEIYIVIDRLKLKMTQKTVSNLVSNLIRRVA